MSEALKAHLSVFMHSFNWEERREVVSLLNGNRRRTSYSEKVLNIDDAISGLCVHENEIARKVIKSIVLGLTDHNPVATDCE